ncbi:unnamed protein product [Chrysodeixis includens]|uniref:Uncharacterized protein n=1 Tax=Chrysodeixis includens TaxID=689277 RepID=A0A9N8Q133_CHRIL|nr:unnamed protein product [Chrysodeixis includens]
MHHTSRSGSGARAQRGDYSHSAVRPRCSMAARVTLASLALLATAYLAHAQDAIIYVDASNRTHSRLSVRESQKELESLVTDLQATKADAQLLYIDFASRAGNDLKTFLRNMTGFADNIMDKVDADDRYNNTDECWTKFEYRTKKIEHDARKAAVFSGDNHHKFLMGHMIVFRMHLNKSEDYLKRCDKVTRSCDNCETTPRIKRWRRLALDEIHRVREDMPFTRRSYRDLVSHARRKLNHLRKQAINRARDAVEDYKYCLRRGTEQTTKSLVHKFETDAATSRTLQEYDKNQMRSWADTAQVQRLEACVQYRLQMIKHQEHNFKSDRNAKWNDCLYAHRNDTRQASTQYHGNEQQCLRQAASEDVEQKENVKLWEKEISKWRKGYRYIINLCRDENPENKYMAEQCVVRYMQNDKYDELIHRLLQLKQVAMTGLQDYYSSSQAALDRCLNASLSQYLDRVRAVMNVLNKCYSIT